MDPTESRSRSPSLLDAGEHGAAPERILSGMEGTASKPSIANKPHRWLWPSALLLVGCAAALLLVLGGAFDDTGSTTSSRMATHVATESVAPVASPSVATASPEARYGDAAPNAAVILPESPESINAQIVAAPAAAASASKDSLVLSDVFTPASERQRASPVRRVVTRTRVNDDSDVTLLTALIQHVEVGGPVSKRKLKKAGHVIKPTATADSIEARMQTCPAANTEAGLLCRQKLCAGHSGQAAACPAAASDASGA